MRSILTSLTFWVFVVWSCVVLGGSLYEAVAVWPLVASDPPRSLAATNQVLAVPGRAGMFFWSWATPGLGLVGLASLLTSFGTPRPHMTWRVASTVLLLVAVAATLLSTKGWNLREAKIEVSLRRIASHQPNRYQVGV
jgi:hypothetical protein